MPFSCRNLSLSDGCVYHKIWKKRESKKRLNKPGKGQSADISEIWAETFAKMYTT